MSELFKNVDEVQLPKYQRDAIDVLTEYQSTEELVRVMKMHVFEQNQVEVIVRDVRKNFKHVDKRQHKMDYANRRQANRRDRRCIHVS